MKLKVTIALMVQIFSQKFDALYSTPTNDIMKPNYDIPSLTPRYSTHVFTFDHVYDQNCDQSTVYQLTACTPHPIHAVLFS